MRKYLKRYFILFAIGFVGGLLYFFVATTSGELAAVWGVQLFLDSVIFGLVLAIIYQAILLSIKKRITTGSLFYSFLFFSIGAYIANLSLAYAGLLFWILSTVPSHFNAL